MEHTGPGISEEACRGRNSELWAAWVADITTMPTPKHTGNISCHFQQDTFLILKSWDFGAQPVSSEQNSKCKLGSLHNTHTTCERRQKQSDKCNVTSISQLTSTHSNLSGCKPISFPLSQPRYCYYPAGFLHESSHKNKQTKKWELSQKRTEDVSWDRDPKNHSWHSVTRANICVEIQSFMYAILLPIFAAICIFLRQQQYQH